MTGQTREDKLRAVALRYEDVQQQLADPSVYADAQRLRALSPETRVCPGHGLPTTIGEER